MSSDFWAGYLSGALGILVGNPLDVLKTKLQASSSSTQAASEPLLKQLHWTRGAAAPIAGYGALNALLFVTYNRSLSLLDRENPSSEAAAAWAVWTAGALGGLATCVVSAPTELVKCRVQVSERRAQSSSMDVLRAVWRTEGLRGLYRGGCVTAVRDAVGYGFYFWSYEVSKRFLADAYGPEREALHVLLCGGLAGVVTWASVFPIDVVKTRVQTWDLNCTESRPLLAHTAAAAARRPSAFAIAREAYRAEGFAVFFRGLGVCSARAFVVNAVQWTVYEWTMKFLSQR